jgi:hypothetical protein
LFIDSLVLHQFFSLSLCFSVFLPIVRFTFFRKWDPGLKFIVCWWFQVWLSVDSRFWFYFFLILCYDLCSHNFPQILGFEISFSIAFQFLSFPRQVWISIRVSLYDFQFINCWLLMVTESQICVVTVIAERFGESSF